MDGLTVLTSCVDGFEGFRDAVHGSHVDVMQLQRGRFRGLLTHIGVGDFSLSVGSFRVGLRTQRTSSDPKLIVGMLLGTESRVTHWSYDMDPGDVLVIPPGVDHDGRFHGAASYAALRFDLADVAGAFGGESWMSDPANWRHKHRYRADPRIGAEAVARLREIVSRLSDPDARVSPEAADFWRRAIIDVVTAPVMHSQPPGTTATTTIAEIALQHGFLNLGRFSGYYRALFDEYPSETFGKRYPGRGRQRPAGPVATSSAASPASRSIASLHSNYARY